MSDNVIEIRDLSKMYRLYSSPTYKMLDLFGLNFKKDTYQEFWALRDVNLEIKRGEKVGFVGRNGAGKTTLLSIIAGNIAPTSGSVRVNGRVNALFTLGTGFHPEFSGRENISASLAFQGVTGGDVKRLTNEIIEFSELEEFIEQPLKTYSAGMYARLAFTVATAVKPEMLIIDEILGAGDAYFASKAVERMKELTGGGTTVLFVSHDLSSVQRLCERSVWIDRGRVVTSGDTLGVIKAYSADVRKREESRLRAKSLGLSRKSLSDGAAGMQVIFRLIGESGKPPAKGLPVHRFAFFLDGRKSSEVLVGDSMDNNPNEGSYVITDKGLINWGEPYRLGDRWARDFADVGGRYLHAAGVYKMPPGAELKDLSIEMEYMDGADGEVRLEVYLEDEKRYETIGTVKPSGLMQWKTLRARSNRNELQKEAGIGSGEYVIDSAVDVYGTGKAGIKSVCFKDAAGRHKFVFDEGEVISIVVDVVVKEKLGGRPYMGYAMFDDKGTVISNFFKMLNVTEQGDYFVEIELKNSHLLRKGRYIFSVALYEDVDPSDVSRPWPAYIVLDRKFEIQIRPSFETAVSTGIVELAPEMNLVKSGYGRE